jgi:ferredoxin
LAVPFVTYGKINSGVALPQAAKLLRRSGRTVVAGMKISAMHSLTKLPRITCEINPGMPGAEALPLVEDLAGRIVRAGRMNPEDCPDISDHLRYQRLRSRLKFAVLFQEKIWQRYLFPKLTFDLKKCIGCGSCVRVCPVQRLEQNGAEPQAVNGGPECVSCGSCVADCPEEAVHFKAYWPMWNWVLREGAAGRGFLPSGEPYESAVYPL